MSEFRKQSRAVGELAELARSLNVLFTVDANGVTWIGGERRFSSWLLVTSEDIREAAAIRRQPVPRN